MEITSTSPKKIAEHILNMGVETEIKEGNFIYKIEKKTYTEDALIEAIATAIINSRLFNFLKNKNKELVNDGAIMLAKMIVSFIRSRKRIK